MSFVVSARKYRPAKFRDVVGQKTITTTLKNAIKNDKLAQSFLFCGPRGVGKTTCARILAKVINCQSPTSDTEACNECQACVSFNNSASFNIFELDAASNNSVEDIRNLIEQVRFAPQVGKYKIYIIDEVHMLSQAAFNAFLKTLEEPPKYAIFILATTEKHKILPTILSRCQIFDFQRIRVSDIVEHLHYICEDQQIDAEENALHVIAQKADGGLRDALSIFDRIASYSDGHLKYENVVDALNMLDYDYFFKVTDALLAQDTATALLSYDQVVRRGFEGDNFIAGLCEHFRNLFVCKDAATVELLDVTQNLRDRYAQQARLASSSFLLTALNIATQAEIAYKTSKQKHLPIELALLKMCCINNVIEWSSLPVGTITASVEKKNDTLKPPTPYAQNTLPPNAALVNEPTEKTGNLLQKYQQNVPLSTETINIKNPPQNVATTTLPIAEKNTEAVVANTQLETLTQDTVLQYWKEYAAKLDAPVTKNAFNAITPQLEGRSILIELTALQDKAMNSECPKFLGFLKQQKNIENYSLERKIVQSKQVLSENTFRPTAYRPEEQLKEMIQTNPKLADLVTRLKLEVE
jgi:DNA polymerase-3 subunit gamma/tau